MKVLYKSRSGGFTLMEIIIVIVIIGILSFIGIARFQNTIDSINLKVASDKLRDDLRYVRNFAVNNHRNTWFNIDISSNSYSYGIYATPPLGDPQTLIDPSADQPAIIDLDDYNGVSITSETFGGGFYYNWLGTPSIGGQVVLNNTITIVVEEETGYIYEL